jgi:DNA-binding GntR family transcriptional regulator
LQPPEDWYTSSLVKAGFYRKIKEQILQGSASSGGTFSERLLARRLRVSRSPVREALKALEKEGYVRILPRRGTFFASLTPDDVREIYELREALDTFAVRRAAMHPPESLPMLCALFRRLERKGENAAFTEMERAWKKLLEAIVRSLQNRRFWRVYTDLLEQAEVLRTVSARRPERIAEAVALGRKIVEALLERDGPRAERLLRILRSRSRETITRAFLEAEKKGRAESGPENGPGPRGSAVGRTAWRPERNRR